MLPNGTQSNRKAAVAVDFLRLALPAGCAVPAPAALVVPGDPVSAEAPAALRSE